jgi:serine/threonine-protein kinase
LLDFAAQILRALVYAHNLGVVHRDIKPANIMIDQIGVVKLLDFGIAITNHSSELTQKGYMLGSLNYMSPEQINGSKATAQSDIYSLGVTLYEIMTGALPITGNSNYEIMIGHMQRVPVPPYQLAPQVPIAISDAIMRSLAKDPAHRFANADEFLRALHLNPGARELAVAATLPLPNQAIDALQSSGGFPQTSGGLPQSSGGFPQTSGGLPQSSGGFPPTSGGFPQTSGGFQQQKPTSPSGSHNLPLDEVSRKLAVFIGPVAKFVVKKLAAQSDDVDFIYREAAKQIGSDTDRAAFLKSRSR